MVAKWKKKIHTPKVGVAGVVFDSKKNRVLLIDRKYKPKNISLPGGFQQTGKHGKIIKESETISQCCIRETLEETGLLASPIGIMKVTSLPSDDPRLHVLAIYILMKPIKGYCRSTAREEFPVKAGDDAKKAFWADLNVEYYKYEHKMLNTTVSVLNDIRTNNVKTIPLG